MDDETLSEQDERPYFIPLRERIEARRRGVAPKPSYLMTAEEWDARDRGPLTPLVWETERPAQLVYFIQAGDSGPIKIGISYDPAKRLRDLQVGHFDELSILVTTDGGAELEAQLHARFAEHRGKGEWFHPAPAILSEIERLKGNV